MCVCVCVCSIAPVPGTDNSTTYECEMRELCDVRVQKYYTGLCGFVSKTVFFLAEKKKKTNHLTRAMQGDIMLYSTTPAESNRPIDRQDMK